MNKIITMDYIKNLVEIHTGIKDLSINTRDRNVVEARGLYYKLCRLFLKKKYNTYQEIGDSIGRNHATVIHGIKLFDDLENTFSFSYYKEVYDLCFDELSEISSKQSFSDLKTTDELIVKIKEKYIAERKENISNRRTIKALNKKIDLLNDKLKSTDSFSDVLIKLSKLDYADTLDFETRANAFLSMSRIKDKYEHLKDL